MLVLLRQVHKVIRILSMPYIGESNNNDDICLSPDYVLRTRYNYFENKPKPDKERILIIRNPKYPAEELLQSETYSTVSRLHGYVPVIGMYHKSGVADWVSATVASIRRQGNS
jgi:hypothetical protein